MQSNDLKYKTYIQILKEELLPAMGCTEPIAIAYAAAKARQVLGVMPDKVLVKVSGNIVKNAKSVLVPNTGGLNGIEASAAAGIAAGKADKILEVIAEVTKEQQGEIRAFLKNVPIKTEILDDGKVFDIIVDVFAGGDSAMVRISDYHTNIVDIEKNGEIIFSKKKAINVPPSTGLSDRSLLTVKDIFDFVNTVSLNDIAPMIEKQIELNSAIAEEGLKNNYGANIGKTLLKIYGNDVKIRAKAYAAAGSDARMSGCSLPVMIVSGSGNQGITASVPVIQYAKEFNIAKDKLIRAVALSDLVCVHVKAGIGELSAYCGAVCAGVGAGAAIAYIFDAGLDAISHTIVNALAIASGMICDGAKASCAAKISVSVDGGIFGYEMYKNGQQFYGGDGIVSNDVEHTIRNVGLLGKEGMKGTDKEILKIMIGETDA
jgi:L-cysteine desulfidase